MTRSPLEDIRQHLDKADDQVLLILYGHLLIEERLRDIVAQVSRDPNQLQAARLTFNQVMFLCRAIIGRKEEPPWEFLRRLNEARNRIVHRLDPGNLDELLISVIEKLRADYAAELGNSLSRFRTAVVYCCGYLDALRGSTKLRRAYEN